MLDLDFEPGPEVFESSDVESVPELQTLSESPIHNKENFLELSVEGFNAAFARQRFEDHIIIDDNANYLGSITTGLGASGIKVVHWEETKEQKLARLQRELEQMQAEDEEEKRRVDLYLNSLKVMIKSNGEKGYYYQRVSETLDELQRSENAVLARLGDVNDTETQTDKDLNLKSTMNPKEPSSKIVTSNIVLLEARLAKVEAAIGTPSTDPTLRQNLRIHLNDLSRKVNILSSPEETLEPVFVSVSQLNKDLETLLANKRKVDLHLGDRPLNNDKQRNTPFETKIDRLHAKLPEIENTSAILPALITRLRSLHELHSNLATSVAITGEIDNTLQTLLRDLNDWQNNLNDVSTALDESEARFTANAAVVDKKLRLMEERLI